MKKINFSNKQLTEMYIEYLDTKNMRKIAKSMGVSKKTIFNYLKKYEQDNGLKNISLSFSKSTYTYDKNFFNQDTPESFYWAGFIAADGCLTEDYRYPAQKTLAIQLARKDEKQLHLFRKSIKYTGKIFRRVNYSRTDNHPIHLSQLRITMFDPTVHQSLYRFGITRRKSLTYCLPDKIRESPLISHFLRGYFDGDGTATIAKTGNTKSLQIGFVGTRKFLISCQDIIMEKCDINSFRKIRKNDNIYCLTFGGTQIALSVGKFLYNESDNLRLNRKYKIYKKFTHLRNQSFVRPVVAIDIKTSKVSKFNSVAEAARVINADPAGIWHSLSGKQSQCGGFFWKIDDNPQVIFKYK